jgi:hypothetical protein
MVVGYPGAAPPAIEFVPFGEKRYRSSAFDSAACRSDYVSLVRDQLFLSACCVDDGRINDYSSTYHSSTQFSAPESELARCIIRYSRKTNWTTPYRRPGGEEM